MTGFMETVVIAVLVSVGPSLLMAMLRLFVGIFCVSQTTHQCQHVARLDHLVGFSGFCSGHDMRGTRIPSQGWHLLWCKWAPVVFCKSSESVAHGDQVTKYRFWTPRWNSGALLKIEALVVGDPLLLQVRYISSPAPYRTSATTERCAMVSTPRPWQAQAAQQIVGQFKLTGRSSALISGKPSVGKSKLAEVVANQLVQEGLQPVLVKGIDLCAKGVCLDDILIPATSQSPLVLVLDEIDQAIEYALSQTKQASTSDASCLAENKTRLLGTLDRLASTDSLIIVATTNCSIESFCNDSAKAPCVRQGRFDLHVSV